MNNFVKALEGKYRFETQKLLLNLEGLFELPLDPDENESTKDVNPKTGKVEITPEPSLSEVAIKLSRKISDEGGENFTGKKTLKSEKFEIMLEIVKEVIAIKVAARDREIMRKDASKRYKLNQETIAHIKLKERESLTLEQLTVEQEELRKLLV